MGIAYQLSALALRPLINAVCNSFGIESATADIVIGHLRKYFNDPSERLLKALQTANDQAWDVLELSLEDDSLWTRFRAKFGQAETRVLQQTIRSFLESVPPAALASNDLEAFRHQCLLELRQIRKAGLLHDAGLQVQSLRREICPLARYAKPLEILDSELRLAERIGDELRREGCGNLAALLTVCSPQHPPILVTTVRYFFRRQVETDQELFRGLVWEKLGTLEGALGAMAEALTRNGEQLKNLLSNMHQQTDQQLKELLVLVRRIVQVNEPDVSVKSSEPLPGNQPADGIAGANESTQPLAVVLPVVSSPLPPETSVSASAVSPESVSLILEGHKEAILAVAFSRKGRRCFSADRGGTVLVWDTATGKESRCLNLEVARFDDQKRQRVHPECLAFLRDGSVLFTDKNTGFFRVEIPGSKPNKTASSNPAPVPKSRTPRTAHQMRRSHEFLSWLHPKEATTLAFSADGERALTVTADSTVRLWDFKKDGEVLCLNSGFLAPKHEGLVTCGALSACGKYAATGGTDRTLRLWDLATGRQVYCWEGHTAEVTCIVFVPDAENDDSLGNQRLLSGCHDGTIRLWELECGAKRKRGRLIRVFLGHSAPIRSLTCTPNGSRFLSGAGSALSRSRLEGTIERAIPIKSGTRIKAGTRPPKEPSERRVMIDCTVRLWDVFSDIELARFGGHTDPVTSVAYSPDGRWAASGSSDGAVHLWSLPR